VWHWSALRTGLALAPTPALVPIVTVHRFGRGALVTVGGLLFAAGMQSLPPDRAATRSTLANSVRQISASIGVALLGDDRRRTGRKRLGGRVPLGVDRAAALTVGTALVGVSMTRPGRISVHPSFAE
jgi:hypothetical protein